jgi:hypothetical protein
MNKIKWCADQKKGIKLVKPSNRISQDYINEADIDLKDLDKSSLKWKNIVGYYACYNALYSVLQKIGIKCEIHDCSIELMDYIGLRDYTKFLLELKKNRINVQYYLKKPKQVNDKDIIDFVLECKIILNSLNEDKIDKIRKIIKDLTKLHTNL